MRHTFILAQAVVFGLLAWGWINDANAASRLNGHTSSELAHTGGTTDTRVPIAHSQ